MISILNNKKKHREQIYRRFYYNAKPYSRYSKLLKIDINKYYKDIYA